MLETESTTTTFSIDERARQARASHASFLDLLSSRGKTPNKLWSKYYYDPESASRAVNFIEGYLTFVEGPIGIVGHPFKLIRWQKRIVCKLFGWKRWADGTRKYRFLFLFVPKKNNKTTFVAALANYAAFADREPAPNIACVAADKEQAGEIFKMVAGQIRANPKLSRRCKIYKQAVSLVGRLGAIRVVSKKPQGKHGPNWHVVIADECHAIENEETVKALTAGIIARTQPLVCYLSTAGFDRTHWFYREYEYAKLIRDGVIPKEDYLVVIYEADPEKWKERSEWYKANPSLGVTINLTAFEGEFEKASQLPTEENHFKRLHLNIWTHGETKAVPMDRWAECYYPENDPELLNKQRCYVGVDLAATIDLAAAAFLFPPTDTRPYYDLHMEFWYPEGNIDLRKKKLGGFDLTPWADQGFITFTPGEVIDYEIIRARIRELGKIWKIKEIAIDAWEATETATQLDAEGFTVVPVRLGFKSMNFPTKFLLQQIVKRTINHRNNPVLTWNAANLQTEEDAAGNIKPSKRRSKEKIDGMVALILAMDRACRNIKKKSFYAEHDIRVIG